MTGPARITIELEPPTTDNGRWAARTWVDEPLTVTANDVVATEAREPAIVPTPYEPPQDCTCVEGFCDTDHANE